MLFSNFPKPNLKTGINIIHLLTNKGLAAMDTKHTILYSYFQKKSLKHDSSFQ